VKGLSRRDFLKLCAGSAAAVSLSELLLPHLLEAAPASGNPPALWIQGASCTGCSVSLLDSEQPAIATILTDVISLKFHPNISGASGYLATKVINDTAAAGGFYLVVEGSVPTGANGMYCTVGETENGQTITFVDRLADLGSKAAAVLAVAPVPLSAVSPPPPMAAIPPPTAVPPGAWACSNSSSKKGSPLR
jgi:hydrogenase small subunit